MTHIVFEQLCDWVEARLTGAAEASVTAHLQRCSACADDAAWLRQTVTLMRTDTSTDAPAVVQERARRLFRRQPSLVQRLRQLVATVRFDSAVAGPAFGVRAGTSAVRQLVLEAPPFTLDVHASAAPGGWVVAGQVLGPVVAGQARLSNAEQMVTVALNELAEFTLPTVPSGVYQLAVRLAADEVIMPDLVLGA